MEDRIFKKLGDGQEIDLISYVREKLSESSDIKLYIGADSQNVGSKTVYANVIVFHYPNNGGHVIYAKYEVPLIKDRFSKLWNEVEDSVNIAKYLESNGIRKPNFIDLDFNADPKFQSNSILRSALGYVESMGFIARYKPYAISASYIADKIVNMKRKRPLILKKVKKLKVHK